MILRAEQIANLIETGEAVKDPLVIAPMPDLPSLRASGAASLDIRLGTWFAVPRQSRIGVFDIAKISRNAYESQHTEMHYVPFGSTYILQPRGFVLGVTLEWIRLPKNLAGYVTARSSWGRRGLIIATAVGVHPGFTGCLSLELSNVGEIPIALHPGMAISQFFIHQVVGDSDFIDRSCFVGMRRPVLGPIELDDMAKKLGKEP
jgi:dCTP deaminase